MKRGVVASLLAGAVVLLAFVFRAPVSADEPASTFSAHEWGVWVIDEGHVAHLPALAEECPDFVIRAPRSQEGARTIPRIRMSPVTVEKPVIFFHTDEVIDNVRVRVRFRRGEPWLIWPEAQVRRRGVEWNGRLTPHGGTDLGPVMHHGQRHPWWGHLRRAGGARFEPASGSPPEDFLFYDGTMPFRSGFTFIQSGPTWVPRRRGVESKVWVQDGQQVHAYEVARRQTGSEPTAHPSNAIIALLRAELLSRGLQAGEADSLLNTWRDDLQPAAANGRPPQPRAIYFVDRAGYDRMLPLTISPTPDEVVRVGLVIEMLRP